MRTLKKLEATPNENMLVKRNVKDILKELEEEPVDSLPNEEFKISNNYFEIEVILNQGRKSIKQSDLEWYTRMNEKVLRQIRIPFDSCLVELYPQQEIPRWVSIFLQEKSFVSGTSNSIICGVFGGKLKELESILTPIHGRETYLCTSEEFGKCSMFIGGINSLT